MNSLCGIDVIVYTQRHLHKSTWFYVIIKRMRKQTRLGSRLTGSIPVSKYTHLFASGAKILQIEIVHILKWQPDYNNMQQGISKCLILQAVSIPHNAQS